MHVWRTYNLTTCKFTSMLFSKCNTRRLGHVRKIGQHTGTQVTFNDEMVGIQ